jgi:heat shock protein HslJ
MKTVLAFFAFIVLAFFSCNSGKKTLSSDSLFFSDASRVWKLNSMEDWVPAEIEKQIRFLVFSKNENRAYGSGGCNRFSGSFSLSGEKGIQFGPMAATRMACVNMQTEDRFFKLLAAVKSYQVKSRNLILTGTLDGKDFKLNFSAGNLKGK